MTLAWEIYSPKSERRDSGRFYSLSHYRFLSLSLSPSISLSLSLPVPALHNIECTICVFFLFCLFPTPRDLLYLYFLSPLFSIFVSFPPLNSIFHSMFIYLVLLVYLPWVVQFTCPTFLLCFPLLTLSVTSLSFIINSYLWWCHPLPLWKVARDSLWKGDCVTNSYLSFFLPPSPLLPRLTLH